VFGLGYNSVKAEGGMENWKVALVSGAAGVGTAMFLKKKWTAGVILAGVGLATLASEYPEKFAEVRRRLPDFIERGNNFLEVATRVGDRLAEAAESRSQTWYESLLTHRTPLAVGRLLDAQSFPGIGAEPLWSPGRSPHYVDGGIAHSGHLFHPGFDLLTDHDVRGTPLGGKRHVHGHVLLFFRRGFEADAVNQSQIDNVDRNFRIVTLLQGA
jgi:hypothetical protein